MAVTLHALTFEGNITEVYQSPHSYETFEKAITEFKIYLSLFIGEENEIPTLEEWSTDNGYTIEIADFHEHKLD